MNTSIGIINEENFVKSLNGKMFNEVNKNLQLLLYYIFPHIDKSKKFTCYRTEYLIKPDIVISQESTMKFLSLKYGQSETLHNENILTFIQYLRESGISEETIETYLLYHYGDGTLDGTGEKRMNSIEVRFTYDERIKKMNAEFNSSKEFIKEFADRVMFQGVNPSASMAEYIYHGDVDYGVICSRNQFRRHIETKNWDYMTTCVHVGPFVLRPHARYANKEIRNEESRKTVEVNYPRLCQDITYISLRYAYVFQPNKKW